LQRIAVLFFNLPFPVQYHRRKGIRAEQGEALSEEHWTDKQRVAITWAVCTGAFILFNLVFWPARAYQAWHAPENFQARAELHYAQGDVEAALHDIRQGIDRFHPSQAHPYRTKAAWLEAGDPEFDLATATGRFYAYRDGSQEDDLLPQALDQVTRHYPPRTFQSDLLPALETLCTALLRACHIPEPDWTWTIPRRLALLESAHGIVAFDGLIGRTGLRAPVDLMVQSGGGAGTSRVAHIFVGTQEYATYRRGLHATILDPQSGVVLQTGLFDLWEHAQEADRMLRFLSDAPQGAIGIFAVFDDAAVNLTPALEEALLGFGLKRHILVNRRPVLIGLRHSFAAIGVKGAGAGTAFQTWSPESFQETPGHPVAIVVLAPEEATP